MIASPIDPDALRHPKERRYFIIALAVSVALYVVAVITLFSLVYGALIAAFMLIARGLLIGHLKGNGVRVSRTQFPGVADRAAEIARRLGFVEVPDIYVVQAGGLLNAMAIRFLGRSFVVIYSDLMELVDRGVPDAVAFVLAHEMAHLRFGHTWKRLLLAPAALVPFLLPAYSRACEYSCDAVGVALEPGGAVSGLSVLAVGKRLVHAVDVESLSAQASTTGDVWMWLAEHVATHPFLPKRMAAVLARGAVPPTR